MRRAIFISLTLAGLGGVAVVMGHMVAAQEWSRWTPPPSPAAAMIENPTAGRSVQPRPSLATELFEPNRILAAADGKLPSPAAKAGSNHWAAAHAPPEPEAAEQSGTHQPGRATASLPPLRIENPYFQEPSQAPTIRQAQAVTELPAAGKAESQAGISPSDEMPMLVDPSASTAEQPAAAAPSAASNAAATIVEAASSRRPKPFAAPAPRLAEREIRANPPAAAASASPSPAAPADHLQAPPAQRSGTDETQAAPSVLFTAEAPVLAARTAGPATIAIGKAATYAIEIANCGAAEADDVAVLIDLPPWAEVASFDATSGEARFAPVGQESGRIKWSIYQLAASKREQITLKIIPRQSRPIELAVSWTYAPKTRSAQIEVQEPKLQLALAGPQEVHYGQTKTYTITLANPGTGAAENVTLQLLPVTGGEDSGGTSRIGTIEAGGRRTVEIELTARQAGDLELRAQAFADGGLRCEGSQAIHVRRGLLEITAAGPPLKYAGTTAVYQVRVANAGDAAISNVTAAAALPRGAALVSASEGGALQPDQARVQWQLGPMRPGAARVLELRCTLAEAGSNRVDFLASGSDDLSAAAQCVTRVEALADLKLQINDPPGPAAAGEPVVYEVTLVNRGTKAAERVQIHAMFSEGIEPLAIDGAAGALQAGRIALEPIERIAAGEQLTVKITARARTAGNHTFGVQLVCADPQTQLAAQEATQFYDSGPAGSPLSPREAALPPRRESLP